MWKKEGPFSYLHDNRMIGDNMDDDHDQWMMGAVW